MNLPRIHILYILVRVLFKKKKTGQISHFVELLVQQVKLEITTTSWEKISDPFISAMFWSAMYS